MGGEHPGEAHVVARQHLEDAGRVVGRVDDDGLARLSVADQIHEVHHLAGQLVGCGRCRVRRAAGGSKDGRGRLRRRRSCPHSRRIRAHLGRGTCSSAHHGGALVDDLPEVLPTDRLTVTGMPRPFLREELRRIPGRRNVLNVVSVWVQGLGLLAAGLLADPRLALPLALVVWAVAFVLDGSGLRPLLDPRPRGGPPTPVLPAGRQRPGREVAARLPGLRALRRLPPQPLRPPSRRAGPQRARPQPVPGLSGHRRLVATQAAPRRPGELGLEEPEGAVARPHQGELAGRSPCASSPPRRCCSSPWAWSRVGGGCGR